MGQAEWDRSVWWPSPIARQMDGPRTHAIVIGISRYLHVLGGDQPKPYDEYGIGQLTTPATGAYRFARWLIDRFNRVHHPTAELGTVRLLLSPSRQELADNPALAKVPRASRGELVHALEGWRRDCDRDPDGTAILYITGHGMLLDAETPVVLLEDYAAEPRIFEASLNVGHVHKAMSGIAACRQFYFVDACQTLSRPRVRQGDGELMGDERQMDERTCAPIYFSAAPGQPSNVLARSGSIFLQALLGCLEGRAAERGPLGWEVTNFRLTPVLCRDVAAIAAEAGLVQRVSPAGIDGEATLHVLREAPRVRIRISVAPAEVAPRVAGTLLDASDVVLKDGIQFSAGPFDYSGPPGIYGMRIRGIHPPDWFDSRLGRWYAENPEGVEDTVKVD